MSNIKIIKGNLFKTKAQTLVNTVNTVGVMGAGVALECRLRYPEMFEKYVELCKIKQIQIGKLWLYKSPDRWILNFPTKEDWKDESKIEYLEKGLTKFVTTYKEKGITSIAFPVLGARHGKIPENVSLKLMKLHLKKCDIPIEIYKFDYNAPDELHRQLKRKIKGLSIENIIFKTGIQKQYIKKLLDALKDKKINNLTKLSHVEGIGIRTLVKIFDFIFDRTDLKNNEDLELPFNEQEQ